MRLHVYLFNVPLFLPPSFFFFVSSLCINKTTHRAQPLLGNMRGFSQPRMAGQADGAFRGSSEEFVIVLHVLYCRQRAAMEHPKNPEERMRPLCFRQPHSRTVQQHRENCRLKFGRMVYVHCRTPWHNPIKRCGLCSLSCAMTSKRK